LIHRTATLACCFFFEGRLRGCLLAGPHRHAERDGESRKATKATIGHSRFSCIPNSRRGTGFSPFCLRVPNGDTLLRSLDDFKKMFSQWLSPLNRKVDGHRTTV
jgi:hypothetical protein